LAAWVDDSKAKVNPAWMRGVDSLQIVWRDIESGESYSRAPLLDDSSPRCVDICSLFGYAG
jgi:hypothetical protein